MNLIFVAFYYTGTPGGSPLSVAHELVGALRIVAFFIGCGLLLSGGRLGFHLRSSPFISPSFHVIHLNFSPITLGAVVLYLALTVGLH
jgi:hypothetical protein